MRFLAQFGLLLPLLACDQPDTTAMWRPVADELCRYDYGTCPYTCWPVEPRAYVEAAWECVGDPDNPSPHDDCVEAEVRYYGDEAYDQLCLYCGEPAVDTGGDPPAQTYLRAHLCVDVGAPDTGITTSR